MNFDDRKLGTVALKAYFRRDLFYGKYPSFILFKIIKKQKEKKTILMCVGFFFSHAQVWDVCGEDNISI